MSFANFNIGKNASNYETSEVFDAYGRVDVVMGEDDEGNIIVVSYPNVPDKSVSGRILTVDIPMCTSTNLARTAAQRIYTELTTKNNTSFQYAPMMAEQTLADPSMEFGDSVDINGRHSGFYTRVVTFGRLMATDLTSPTDEEIDHEYPFVEKQERQITRTNKEMKASLSVTASAISAEVQARTTQGDQLSTQISQTAAQISAKVSQKGGNNSSFGWSLLATEFGLYSKSKKVFYVNSNGAHVNGEITAKSGEIGGFTIAASSMSTNGLTWEDTTITRGIYFGTKGIRLGQKFWVDTSGHMEASDLKITGGNITIKDQNNNVNFRVTSSGALTAVNCTLSGTLKIGGKTITASDLQSGAQSAASNSSTWSSTSETVSSNSGTWSTGASYGYNFDSMKNGGSSAYPINASSFRYNGLQLRPQDISFKDGNGITRTFSGVLRYVEE